MRERADLYVPWELRGELLAVSVVCLVLRVSFMAFAHSIADCCCCVPREC